MANVERENWDGMFVMDHLQNTNLAKNSGIALLSFHDITNYLGSGAQPNNWILFDVLPLTVEPFNRGAHWRVRNCDTSKGTVELAFFDMSAGMDFIPESPIEIPMDEPFFTGVEVLEILDQNIAEIPHLSDEDINQAIVFRRIAQKTHWSEGAKAHMPLDGISEKFRYILPQR